MASWYKLKPGQWHARRYKYADGVAYRQNCYQIYVPVEDEFDDRAEAVIGGAVVLRDKVIAFIGDVGPMEGIRTIIAVATEYVWGSDLRDALSKLRTRMPNPFDGRKPKLP